MSQAIQLHLDRCLNGSQTVNELRQFVRELALSGRLVAGSSPITWVHTTLGAVGVWGSGGTPKRDNPAYYGGSIPWLVIGDLNDGLVTGAANKITEIGLAQSSAKIVEPGSVLIAMYGSIGKLGLAGIRCATNQAIAHCVVDPTIVSADYLMLVLRSYRRALLARGQGGTQPNISQTILKAWPVSLPPLPEQHRIVARFAELMALLDQLEAAQAEREARRDQLRRTSLWSLVESGGSKGSASFFLKNSRRMITKPEHVAGVRQAVLDLAVRGRLLPQNLADEPIRPTVDAVLARRAVLVGSKAVRKKDLDGRGPLLRGGDLPDSWTTESLGNLVDPENAISYGVLVPGDHVPAGVPLVRAQDLSISAPAAMPNKSIAPDIERAYARTRLHGGEILVCVVGSIGKLGVAPASWAGANIARAVARIDPVPEISRDYLLIALRTSMVQDYFQMTTRTLAQPTLNVGLIELTPIPLPPRAEQDRIVAKVDELMTVCDDLERSRATEQTQRARLLAALLQDALEDALPARELELLTAR